MFPGLICTVQIDRSCAAYQKGLLGSRYMLTCATLFVGLSVRVVVSSASSVTCSLVVLFFLVQPQRGCLTVHGFFIWLLWTGVRRFWELDFLPSACFCTWGFQRGCKNVSSQLSDTMVKTCFTILKPYDHPYEIPNPNHLGIFPEFRLTEVSVGCGFALQG